MEKEWKKKRRMNNVCDCFLWPLIPLGSIKPLYMLQSAYHRSLIRYLPSNIFSFWLHLFRFTLPYPMTFYPVLSYPILSYLIPFDPLLSSPLLSNPNKFYLFLYSLILCCCLFIDHPPLPLSNMLLTDLIFSKESSSLASPEAELLNSATESLWPKIPLESRKSRLKCIPG